MATLPISGKCIINSCTPTADPLVWGVEVDYSDASGTFSPYDIQVNDLILVDSSTQVPGNLLVLKITEVVSHGIPTSSLVVTIVGDTVNTWDLNFALFMDNLFVRPGSNGLVVVPSYMQQGISETLYNLGVAYNSLQAASFAYADQLLVESMAYTDQKVGSGGSSTGGEVVTRTNAGTETIPQFYFASENEDGTSCSIMDLSNPDDETFTFVALEDVAPGASGRFQKTGTVTDALVGIVSSAEISIYANTPKGKPCLTPSEVSGEIVYYIGKSTGTNGKDLLLEPMATSRNP